MLMRKHQRQKVIILIIFICGGLYSCSLDNSSPSPQPQSPCETRGVWLWGASIDSPQKRNTVIQTLTNAHINTIFVAAPRVESHYGHGNEEDFNEFIKIAFEKGFSIHCWLSNARRPGGGVLADFRDPVEQQTQTAWVKTLMSRFGQYLHGVHLDYIRFTNGEPVNEEGKMDGVTETIRQISRMLKSSFPGKYLTATCLRLVPSRVERYSGNPLWTENVPQWFRNWFAQNRGGMYDQNNTAFVPMHMKYQQNPIAWLNEKIVDFVTPMEYSTHDDEWNPALDYCKSFNRFVGNPITSIYMGLGWMPPTSAESHKGFDAPGLVRKIKYGRSAGMKGFVIFIFFNEGADDNTLIQALTVNSAMNGNDAPFKNTAPSCLK